MDNQIFNGNKYLKIKGSLYHIDRPKVMGILNISEDSFYDGGRYGTEADMLRRVEVMINEGADFIDIGAQSSRPGASEKGAKEELKLLLPIIKSINKNFSDVILSVDSWHSQVAEEVANHGVDMINDISGGTFDDKMFETIARLRMPYVLMHTGGRPAVMQQNPNYNDVVQDVIYFLSQQLLKLNELGIPDVIVDPGFGFGKTMEHNYILMNALEHFTYLERPILVGISRKSMIYNKLNTNPEQALAGTIALNMVALQKGADILRVHDVKEAVDTITMFMALKEL